MDDTAVRRYFTQPTHIFHRRYEALRAVIVDGRSQKVVAEELGFQYHSLRQLVYEFRHSFDARQAATKSQHCSALGLLGRKLSVFAARFLRSVGLRLSFAHGDLQFRDESC